MSDKGLLRISIHPKARLNKSARGIEVIVFPVKSFAVPGTSTLNAEVIIGPLRQHTGARGRLQDALSQLDAGRNTTALHLHYSNGFKAVDIGRLITEHDILETSIQLRVGKMRGVRVRTQACVGLKHHPK